MLGLIKSIIDGVVGFLGRVCRRPAGQQQQQQPDTPAQHQNSNPGPLDAAEVRAQRLRHLEQVGISFLKKIFFLRDVLTCLNLLSFFSAESDQAQAQGWFLFLNDEKMKKTILSCFWVDILLLLIILLQSYCYYY